MIRKLMENKNTHEKESKRNYEIQRIETFSDGVFAFAVTLLIVSLEVPKNFEELMVNIHGFFAFGVSFVLLVLIWSEQHKFFRKYGLEDDWTIILNVALLFLVLFYVYPLKFLFSLAFNAGNQGKSPITDAQVPSLMEIYALGYIAIYFLFTLMYLHAYKRADFLKLTTIEKFDCKTITYKQIIVVIVGCCALFSAMLVPQKYAGFTGFVYVLIGPALTIFFFIRTRKRKKDFEGA
jgi:uncharacterized membrane protein